MEKYISTAADGLRGELHLPGDKSISHRALIFAAIAQGTSRIGGLNRGADVTATRNIFKQLGVTYRESKEDVLEVKSPGMQHWNLQGLKEFDCMNSGTTARLLTGLFAAIPGLQCRMKGDESLSRRPMDRVINPLKQMGAEISSSDGRMPLMIEGQRLHGIRYDIPMASAQVKSALMLAGLSAGGKTVLRELASVRDHSERFFRALGLPLNSNGLEHEVRSMDSDPAAFDMQVPGDPSAAAFWITAALITKGSHIRLKNVSLNPGRITFIRVLQRAGARITLISGADQPEPIGDIDVESGPLTELKVHENERAHVIDEYPVLALIAAAGSCDSSFQGVAELRSKESDRINSIVSTLNAIGVKTEEYPDGFKVFGNNSFRAAAIDPKHDHRIAMIAAVAGLITPEPVSILDPDVATVSYPEFYADLETLKSGSKK